MALTSSPTLISPLRESSRRTESRTGLAKPSRSFASSLTSRTSRPTGNSASGAPLSLSGIGIPPLALYPSLVTSRLPRDEDLGPARSPLCHHGPHQLTKRFAPLKRHPPIVRIRSARPPRGSARNPPIILPVSYDFSNFIGYTLMAMSASES